MSVKITEFGGDALSRAQKVLAYFPGEVDKAVKAALSRAASHLRTKSTERIRERYAISAQNIRANQTVNIRYMGASGEGSVANVVFSGARIPLYRFDGSSPKAPSFQEDRLVHAMVHGHWRMVHPGVAASGHQLRDTPPTKFENAFTAVMNSGHRGIFERNGNSIQELMGSSVAQMIGSEEVAQKLAEDASVKFGERLDHEVARILSGYGR